MVSTFDFPYDIQSWLSSSPRQVWVTTYQSQLISLRFDEDISLPPEIKLVEQVPEITGNLQSFDDDAVVASNAKVLKLPELFTGETLEPHPAFERITEHLSGGQVKRITVCDDKGVVSIGRVSWLVSSFEGRSFSQKASASMEAARRFLPIRALGP